MGRGVKLAIIGMFSRVTIEVKLDEAHESAKDVLDDRCVSHQSFARNEDRTA